MCSILSFIMHTIQVATFWPPRSPIAPAWLGLWSHGIEKEGSGAWALVQVHTWLCPSCWTSRENVSSWTALLYELLSHCLANSQNCDSSKLYALNVVNHWDLCRPHLNHCTSNIYFSKHPSHFWSFRMKLESANDLKGCVMLKSLQTQFLHPTEKPLPNWKAYVEDDTADPRC